MSSLLSRLHRMNAVALVTNWGSEQKSTLGKRGAMSGRGDWKMEGEHVVENPPQRSQGDGLFQKLLETSNNVEVCQ